MSSNNEVRKYYPKYGDIPMLNRKIIRGRRVEITEHPYIVSVRRHVVHYATGSLLKKNLVITVGHLIVGVPTTDLNVVIGENYNDRGSRLSTVLFTFIHEAFDQYSLQADLALLYFYNPVLQKTYVKPIMLTQRSKYAKRSGIVTGWGRCHVIGTEFCLPRSSIYYPGEIQDPMLRSVTIKLQNSTYCNTYARNGVGLRKGMFCLGTARKEHPNEPCMAVPGAPLVIEGQLVGIQSWGFGCGYPNDLPIVYTNLYHYAEWILKVKDIIEVIPPDNFEMVFNVTRAFVMYGWLFDTRKLKLMHKHDEIDLTPWPIDRYLKHVNGYVYDIRDFFEGGKYHQAKLKDFQTRNNVPDKEYLEKIIKNTTEKDIIYRDEDYKDDSMYNVPDPASDSDYDTSKLVDDYSEDYEEPVNRTLYDQLYE